MKQKRNTPGPWKVQHEFDNEPSYIVDVNGIDIGEAVPFDNAVGLLNARLMAAAPEMLDTLERCLAALENITTEDFSKGCDRQIREEMVQAISKATGRGA